jgi:hypothetical protein
MIVKTSYRDHGASALAEYIGRDDHQVRDRAGRELSDRELKRFIDQSDHHGFEREFIVSPEAGDDMPPGELEQRTRQTMREFEDGRPSTRWVYAVHDDTDHEHVHVAATGRRRDLYMDREDIECFRERGTELFREPERERGQEREQEHERERERDGGRSR